MKPLLILPLLLGANFATANAVEPKAGEIVPFKVGDTTRDCILYTPVSWREGSPQKWPVFLSYHGTGGGPTIGLAKRYAGGDAFFLVGMSYSVAGPVPGATAQGFYDTEIENLKAVRDALVEHGGDPSKIYVGGYSKGGWTAGYFADNTPELIAGATVMGAGRNPYRQDDLPKYKDKLPIYIGVGTAEVNYQLGHAGIEHWGSRGADVTFDAYLGYGHVPPVRHRAEYLHQWFTIQRYKDRKTLLRPIFERWHDGTRAAAVKAAKEGEHVHAYLLLEHMASAPLAAYLNATQRKALGGDIAKLRKHPPVAAELKQRGFYKRILDKEVLGGYRLRVWIDVIDDYVRIYEAAPTTVVGKRAIADAQRLLHAMRTSVRPEKRPMVESFMSTNKVIVDKIEAAPVNDLNEELRKLGAFLNEDRSAAGE